MKNRVLAVSALASIALSYQRQTVAAPFVIFAMDDQSCGAWVRSKDDVAMRQTYEFWFAGFVSGYNYGDQSNQVSINAMPDNDTLALFIDKFCADHPLEPFTHAAFGLVHKQRTKK